MIREIVKIDEDLCTGCGDCVPNCHEGALQIIDGKARLISDLMCDGLGACLGHCPEGALTIEKREAEEYNETLVMKDMVKKGKNTVIAHLKHLKDHKEYVYLDEGFKYIEENESELDFSYQQIKNEVMQDKQTIAHHGGGCPGMQTIDFSENTTGTEQAATGEIQSELRQWPVQMHLINPMAGYFQNSDLLLAADCVAFALGDFHRKFLKNKSLGIACPKLDSNMEIYIEKLKALIDDAKVNTITVMKMQVPCCGGILQMAVQAREMAERNVPIKCMTVSLQGEILSEDWI